MEVNRKRIVCLVTSSSNGTYFKLHNSKSTREESRMSKDRNETLGLLWEVSLVLPSSRVTVHC